MRKADDAQWSQAVCKRPLCQWSRAVSLTDVLTGVQSRVLLHVGELLEAALAVGTFVRLLAGVHANVLHQLVVGGEALEALLALVRLDVASAELPARHLHRRLVHEDLGEPRRDQLVGRHMEQRSGNSFWGSHKLCGNI